MNKYYNLPNFIRQQIQHAVCKKITKNKCFTKYESLVLKHCMPSAKYCTAQRVHINTNSLTLTTTFWSWKLAHWLFQR